MSPSSWQAPITALSRVCTVYSIPTDILDALVLASKTICTVYEEEHCLLHMTVVNLDDAPCASAKATHTNTSTNTNKPPVASLGADDMLPIFIYCLTMSSMPEYNMQSLVNELDYICDRESRYSEVGYLVATLQASIQHLLTMDEYRGDEIDE